MSYVRDELENAIGKKWTKRFIGAGIVLLVYLSISFFAGIWPFSSAIGVAKKVTEPERIIQNYEWFYNQYYAIQAQERNLKAVSETSLEYSGMLMVLNNMIGEYNSRSRQITRNLWKADDLPYQIGE